MHKPLTNVDSCKRLLDYKIETSNHSFAETGKGVTFYKEVIFVPFSNEKGTMSLRLILPLFWF